MKTKVVLVVFLWIVAGVFTEKELNHTLVPARCHRHGTLVPTSTSVCSCYEWDTWVTEVIEWRTGVYRTDQSRKCSPFHAAIIWDINTDEHDMRFVYHQRFLYTLISNMPEGSYVVIKTTGDLNSVLAFKKDLNWTEKLHGITVSFTKAAIPYSLLRQTIESYLDQHETNDTDIQLFLLVNDISRMDNEEKTFEALMMINTFVVFTGNVQPPTVWTDLASDENHVHITGDSSDENYRYETAKFLDLSCQNSVSDCGTNMYLNKSRCCKCGYICGRTKDSSPHFCLHACPNFGQLSPIHDMLTDRQDSCMNPLVFLMVTVLVIITIAIIIIFITFAVSKSLKELNKKLERIINQEPMR